MVKKYKIAKSDMKKKTGKNQVFSNEKLRSHNHKLLEIILEARQLSTEDEVIKKLGEALEVDTRKEIKKNPVSRNPFIKWR